MGVRYTSLILLKLLLQLTQNIGVFVNSCPKPLANTHESYLQDTPYFLREVEELNESGKVRNSDILVTVDLSSLYTNIDEGLEAVKDTKFIISIFNCNPLL